MGYIRIIKNLIGLGRLSPAVFVGIPEEAGHELVTIAASNEFGTRDIPERSYLRSTVDENQAKYTKMLAKVVTVGIMKGLGSLQKELDQLGALGVSDVRRKIFTLKKPPNAPSTIEKKGFDDPLVDTGRLGRSITFVVNV